MKIINATNEAELAFVSQVHIGRKLNSLKIIWNSNLTLDGNALVIL